MTSDALEITDVSPRDGLQNQAVPVTTEQKVELVRLLAMAGVTSIEAGSFVSPRAVPQMADSDEVVRRASALDVRRVSALVPNPKGLQRALLCGVGEVAVVLSATETMNRRNINVGLEDAVRISAETLRAAKEHGLRARAYLAVAIECPFEGLVDAGVVCELSGLLVEAGADEVVIADTIGAAAPPQVAALLRAVSGNVPPGRLGVHFHDTRGFGIGNACAALEAGVRRFDASVGGIGGCPFAPGASGNLATEDLVLLARQSGLATGISLGGLVRAVDFAQSVLGVPLGGRCMPWLRRALENPSTERIRGLLA